MCEACDELPLLLTSLAKLTRTTAPSTTMGSPESSAARAAAKVWNSTKAKPRDTLLPRSLTSRISRTCTKAKTGELESWLPTLTQPTCLPEVRKDVQQRALHRDVVQPLDHEHGPIGCIRCCRGEAEASSGWFGRATPIIQGRKQAGELGPCSNRVHSFLSAGPAWSNQVRRRQRMARTGSTPFDGRS